MGKCGKYHRNLRQYSGEVGKLTGEYRYALDAKGRMAVPVKFRAELSNVIYVSKGVGQSLFIYSEKDWREIEAKLAALPISRARRLQLTLFPTATRFELDAQGRILLPLALREYAGLTKDVVVLGVGNRAEIWSEEIWQRFVAEELTQEAMLEAMDELGY
ncbi:MAG: division/cell wall cluster transcriptional repressor MraZ [Oscillospiraceae bacterium]|nr:division/cell wall cluster transcriptional repressor MraZ [Oscillospiraceae bacterium]